MQLTNSKDPTFVVPQMTQIYRAPEYLFNCSYVWSTLRNYGFITLVSEFTVITTVIELKNPSTFKQK